MAKAGRHQHAGREICGCPEVNEGRKGGNERKKK